MYKKSPQTKRLRVKILKNYRDKEEREIIFFILHKCYALSANAFAATA